MSIRKSELLQAEAPLSLGALIHEHVAAGHRTGGGEEFAIAFGAGAPAWRSDRSEAELPQSRVREGADELFEVGPALT